MRKKQGEECEIRRKRENMREKRGKKKEGNG